MQAQFKAAAFKKNTFQAVLESSILLRNVLKILLIISIILLITLYINVLQQGAQLGKTKIVLQ